jgi:hypothetical protein
VTARAFHTRREAPKPGCVFVANGDTPPNRPIGGRSFKDGEVVPIAELGIVHARAVHLWMANRLRVSSTSAQPPASIPAPVAAQASTVSFRATLGERVVFETPAQERKRKNRS